MMGMPLVAGRWTLGLVACLAGSGCGQAEQGLTVDLGK
jgi:hypothetical protein